MKVLQIKKDGVLIPPKVLESGVDFDTLRYCSKDYQYLTFIDGGLDCIVNLSDCFQSRPLIEIDGFCEFNLYMINASDENIVLCTFNQNFYCFDFNGFRYDDRCTFTKLGSIFDPKNQAKYPEIYQEALKLITNN